MSATRVDPVTFQIIRHKLNQIVEEGLIALTNVSGSPLTTEGHDIMVSLYTPEGELLLGGTGFLHHIPPAAQAVKHIVANFTDDPGIYEDDVYFLNDSYTAALHPPDVFIISPIFFRDELRAFVANFVHITDIGAMDPGGFSPNARDSYQEGFQTKGLKIVERGKLRKDVVETFLNMIRDPGLSALDLKSQLAANHVAKERLIKLYKDYGVDNVGAVGEDLIEQSERLMRERLSELPDGAWRVRQYVDMPNQAYKAELTATKRGDSLIYDFTGSDPQAPVGINCSYWATWGGMFAPLFPLLAWDIHWNEGVTRPIRLIAPEGTVVNCQRPAPLSIATVSMINIINNLSTVVLSKMLGASEKYRRRATAVWYGSHSPITTYGLDEDDEWYTALLTDVFAGAGGGRAFKDGVDLGGEVNNLVSRWANVEHHEMRTPLLYLYRRIVPDSGGPGKFRGGMSHEYAFTPHGAGGRSMGLVCYGKGCHVPMGYGLFGGYPGSHTGYSTFREANVSDWPVGWDMTKGSAREDKYWGSQELLPGDMQYIRLVAGGGYADPLDRDPEGVLLDITEGLVTLECAAQVYGVVVDHDSKVIDAAGTQQLRTKLRASRIECPPSRLRPAQEVAATGKRISEYLQQTDERFTQCTWCGCEVAPPGARWKDHASFRRSEPTVAGPWRAHDGRFNLLEFFCPGCGTLLDVDVAFENDPPLHDEVLEWHDSSQIPSQT